jgi:hypothetical protein
MEGSATDKFILAADVVKSLRRSNRQAKNRASAKQSWQKQQERTENLRTECERLTLWDDALAKQYEGMMENVKALAFDVREVETYRANLLRQKRLIVEWEKHESKKT